MFDDCAECSSGKLCQLPDSNPDSESDWDSNSDSDTNCLVSFYRWETPDKHVTKIRISEPYEAATGRFRESFVSLKICIYSKRSQNRHYNHVKESLDHEHIHVQILMLSRTKTHNRTRFKVHILGIAHSAFLQPAVIQNHLKMEA